MRKKQSKSVNVKAMNPLAIAAAMAISASGAYAGVQTYTSGLFDRSIEVNHPGNGFHPSDGDFDGGLAGEFVFGGSDGGYHQLGHVQLNGGLTGRTGDHAGYYLFDFFLGPPPLNNFWYAGIGNDAGPLPSTNSSNVLVFADVFTQAGVPFELRMESDYTFQGNGFKFFGTGAGTWQTIGGALSTATTFGVFNPNDPNLAILFAFGQNGNEITAVDNGTDPSVQPSVRVDNLSMTIAEATWNTDIDNSVWSDNASWTPVAPDGPNALAIFGSVITGARNVNVDGERMAGTLRFDNTNSFTLNGTGTLTLRGIGQQAGIEVLAGSHTISAPVQLLSDMTATITPAGSTMSLTGSLDGLNFKITKAGAGTLRAVNIRAGGLDVSAGKVAILPNGSDAGLSQLGSLTIAGGATPTATLDLDDNDMIVRSGSLATIQSQISNARNGGAWNQPGITSTAAKNQPNGATTLGLLSGSEYIAVNGPTFDGANVAAGDSLVKYTWYGDSDFNGAVDFDDYVRIDGGFNAGLTGWLNGDFDLNSGVDFDDYVLIDNAFNTQNGTLIGAMNWLEGEDRTAENAAIPGVQKVIEHYNQFGTDYVNSFYASVPEPTLGAAAATLMVALKRRRR